MEFKDRYVAFLDILGFKEVLKRDTLEVARIMKIIKDATSKATSSGSHGIFPKDIITSTILSDSIVLSIPAPVEKFEAIKSFRFLLHAVEKIQYNCALENVWIRGGISWGNLYHENSGGNVVGNGLVNAYQFEQTANYPRVLIDPSIIPEYFSKLGGAETRTQFIDDLNISFGAKEYSGKFLFDKRKLNVGFNGYFQDDVPLFINYFNSIYEKDVEDVREKIFQHLRTRLYSSKKTEIYAKYKWVVDYIVTIAPESTPQETGFWHDLTLL